MAGDTGTLRFRAIHNLGEFRMDALTRFLSEAHQQLKAEPRSNRTAKQLRALIPREKLEAWAVDARDQVVRRLAWDVFRRLYSSPLDPNPRSAIVVPRDMYKSLPYKNGRVAGLKVESQKCSGGGVNGTGKRR